jgi:hypothetical protein
MDDQFESCVIKWGPLAARESIESDLTRNQPIPRVCLASTTRGASGKIYGPLPNQSTAVGALLRFLSFVFGFAVTLPEKSIPTVDTVSGLPASERPDTERLPSKPSQVGVFRTSALAIAILPVALLMVASRLEPNSQGLGTHQQLGLPPCSMRVVFGIRCPGCGMTTSWAHFTRGQWLQSWQVNSGGFLLACFSILVACMALRSGWNAQLPSLKTQRIVTVVLVTIGVATLIDWTIRLMAG